MKYVVTLNFDLANAELDYDQIETIRCDLNDADFVCDLLESIGIAGDDLYTCNGDIEEVD